MLDVLKPHSAYKPCHPWIGEVPLHWDVVPGFTAFREKLAKNSGMVVSDVLSLSYGRIVIKPPERLHGLVPASFETYQIVDPGDIIIRPTDLQNDWHSIRVGLSNHRGIITSAYICLHPTSLMMPAYGHLLLLAYDMRKFFYGMGSGLRQSLDYADLNRFPMLVPPPAEQAAIVRFLGAADRRVNRFIRAKRRLIEVLTEQKQAIITHAITRGLNPSAHLKPSGINWLGDVPAHWRTLRLGRTVDLTTGFPFPSAGFTHNAADVPLLRGVNVAPGAVRWSDVVRWPDGDPTLAPFHLRSGDVVLGMDRPVISTGIRVAVVRDADLPCLLLQRVCRLRAHEGLRQSYIPLLLMGRAFADYLAPIFTGISVPHISPEQICSFRVALPPIEEQDRILTVVGEQTRTLDAAIDRTTREIDLIREYRTRLVADVVTGKFDVRGHPWADPGASDDGVGGDDILEVALDANGAGDEDEDGELDTVAAGADTEEA